MARGWRLAVQCGRELVVEICHDLGMLGEQVERPGQRVGLRLEAGGEQDRHLADEVAVIHLAIVFVAGLDQAVEHIGPGCLGRLAPLANHGQQVPLQCARR